jgi:glycosyltransferase involved in cell wall biosynthesis
LGDRIRFLGFRSDVHAIMSVCDALVAPAVYEAYGLGAQEALACGLPVFVTGTAGVAERYPAALQDLLMSLYEDPESLAKRLRSWRMRMPTFRERVKPLSDRLRSHSWNDMAQLVAAQIEAFA